MSSLGDPEGKIALLAGGSGLVGGYVAGPQQLAGDLGVERIVAHRMEECLPRRRYIVAPPLRIAVQGQVEPMG